MFCQGKYYKNASRHFLTLYRSVIASHSKPRKECGYCFNIDETEISDNKKNNFYLHQQSRTFKLHRERESKCQFPHIRKVGNNHPLHNLSCRKYSTISSTVQESLTHWSAKLEEAGVPEGQLSAEHIVAHVLGVSKAKLCDHAAVSLSEDILHELERLMTCRLARMPVQYIVGEWDFHNITLKMRPPVFIPRPETECLVEKVIEQLNGIPNPRVLEIGCGSGAISLALLKCIKDLECIAVDHSKHAVKLTKENAEYLKVDDRLSVVEGKVTPEHFPSLPNEEFNLIVSNPPYVLRKDLMQVEPEIMIYEDMRALDGGKEGLDIIKPILRHCQHFLTPGSSIFMEVDPCHRYLLPSWMKTQADIKLEMTNVFQDFDGKDRFIQFTRI